MSLSKSYKPTISLFKTNTSLDNSYKLLEIVVIFFKKLSSEMSCTIICNSFISKLFFDTSKINLFILKSLYNN